MAKLALCMLAVALAWPHPATATELRRTAIVRAVEQVRPSVVNIHGEKELSREEAALARLEADRRVNGMGTGVVIDPRGYILTNHHVVEGVKKIEVTLHDGANHVARLISRDAKTDLAVIKLDLNEPMPVVPIGTSADLMIGEPVIAVGNAYGYEHTVTRGIISALHRTVEVGEGQRYEDLIQTDASINPGNSGGPLLNIDGDLVGINVAVRAGAQGIGFAIPIDKVLQVAADLMSLRRLGSAWHGLGSASSQKGGVLIEQIEPESPAQSGGLKPGDLLTTINGTRVQRPLDIERALLDRHAGQSVEVQLTRDGETMTRQISLAAAPPARADVTDSSWELLGVKLAQVPARRFREFQSSYRGGLSVVAVRPGSPAAKQGIQRGDVLVGMHIWETVSLDNVDYILSRKDLQEIDPIKFYILRGTHTLYGHLPIAAYEPR